jgi:hypothetical protein
MDHMLYSFLIEQYAIKDWANPFELQTKVISLAFEVTRKTINDARNRLKQRGLIDFIEGKGRGPTIYLFPDAEVTDKALEKSFVFTTRNTTVNTKVNTTVNTTVNTNPQKAEKSAGTPILNNKYNITSIECSNTQSPRGDCSRVSVQPSLFADVEKKKSKQKPKTPKEALPPTPTLEEVRAYFQRKAPDKIQNWEESAQRFYDYFAAVDWRDKYNRRITRWDSRANSWILDEQQRQKENLIKHHVEPTTNRPNPTADERQQRQSELIDFVARNIGSNKGAPGCDGDDLPI